MKVLIVPSIYITNYVNLNQIFLKEVIKNFFLLKLNRDKYNEIKSNLFYRMDQYYFSEFPSIIGKENTFILGNYNEHYKRKKIPKYSRLPSLYNNKEATHINLKDAISNLNSFDCLITGVRTNGVGEVLRNLAKKKGIFCVILDTFDHLDVYKSDKNLDILRIATRNLVFKKDFDLYLKHDVPLNFYSENIVPIAPVPIKIENYPSLAKKSFEEKKNNIFFSGRLHENISPERSQVSNFLSNEFNGVKILNYKEKTKLTVEGYCQILNDTKIAYSPSGKTWDSTRHSELAIYNCIPLIPYPNCRLADNFILNDDNSISYKFIDQKIKSFNLLKEKINFILNSKKIYDDMAESWKKNIYKNNSFLSKSKYIVDKIKNKLIG